MDRFQRLLPADAFFDDAVGVGSADEGFGIFIVGLDVAVDGLAELGDGAEDTALEPVARELGKEALNLGVVVGIGATVPSSQ